MEKIEKSLKITGSNRKLLKPQQKEFNKLTKQVEKLEKQIIRDSEKLNRLLELYSKEVTPAQKLTAQYRLNLAMHLDEVANRLKLSKNQIDKIGNIIVELCNEAFYHITAEPEHKALFDRWSLISFSEEEKIQHEMLKDQMAIHIKQQFGVSINLDDFDGSPEGNVKIKERIEKEVEKKRISQDKSTKKKSKSPIDLTKNQNEDIKAKNIRSIYFSLAKLLHPDLEQNPVARQEKEEIMKKVTVAYEQKDLATLLKLELEWVHKETEYLETLSESKLTIYINVLKDQINELIKQKNLLFQHPRFTDISEFVHLAEPHALKIMTSQADAEKELQWYLQSSSAKISSTNQKHVIKDFLKNYRSQLDSEDYEDDLFDLIVKGYL